MYMFPESFAQMKLMTMMLMKLATKLSVQARPRRWRRRRW